jgi:hypothetical protein
MTRCQTYPVPPAMAKPGLAASSTRRSRFHFSIYSILVLILCLVQTTLAQKDPVVNFCRRFGHQTAVVDNRLYVDGGLIDWNPITSYPNNYTSTCRKAAILLKAQHL